MPFLTKKSKAKAALPLQIVKTSYTSLPVEIPDSFLSTTSATTADQVTYTKIDFSQTPLPEYQGLYAVILDNVLSPSECATLIQMAQRSVITTTTNTDPENSSSGSSTDAWQPAMVNAGPGAEFLATDYRNSDRIIWDEGTVVQRLLDRCFRAERARADLEVLDARHEHILGENAVRLGHRWRATRLNERMRFLRYGPGHFFKEHCDGTYSTPDGRERTFYTLHLYLNDSTAATTGTPTTTPTTTTTTTKQAAAPFPELLIRGGATTFHSRDLKRRLDVNPKAGRVLIFQHRGLLHSGDEVLEGVKYTMRTDLLFERDEAPRGK